MSQPSAQPVRADDLVAVDRRHDARFILNLAGRYALSSKRDTLGNRREFACRALNMSARAMLLAGPVRGPVGDRVIATIDQVGRLEGTIARVMDRGFVVTISGSDEDRVRLEAKLVWLEQFKNFDAADNRRHGRLVPKTPYSTLILADGTTLTCLVIDMSVSGAAVSADVVPEIGMPVAVSQLVGRVVRRFDEGFAVRFVELQAAETLEERLIRPG